jgi:hypothetical protein
MAWSVLLAGVLLVGGTGAPAPSLRGSGRAAQGRCCFNGCDDENSCVMEYDNSSCVTGEKWCPPAAPKQLASGSPSDNVNANATVDASQAPWCKAINKICQIGNECCSGRCGLGAVPVRRCVPNRLASTSSDSYDRASAAVVTFNSTEGKCCFNGCDDENSCVTGYCASQELCLKGQPDGGCDSSPPYGHGAKPSWCPAEAPNQLASGNTSDNVPDNATVNASQEPWCKAINEICQIGNECCSGRCSGRCGLGFCVTRYCAS